jgi:cytochrome c-type biogenesis protein CcmH/NrfG
MVLEANWLYNHRRYFEASTLVKRILTKQPNLVRGWVMKGSLLYVQGEKSLARKAWEHAQTLDPENVEVKQLLEKYK